MENETGLDRNAALADMRYNFIEKVCAESVKKCQESREHKRSVKIDTILTGKYTALPVFFTVILLMFWLTFDVIGSFLSNLLSTGLDWLTALVDQGLTNYEINSVVHSLIIDGIFAGVGSVLSFLPIIVVLFFFLSVLEEPDTWQGVAFVFDKLLRKIGLVRQKRCSDADRLRLYRPAVMATRTLASERDRKNGPSC
jgi:ferrous iron transport protein B